MASAIEKAYSVPRSFRLTEAAARSGNLQLMEWLVSHGVPPSERICQEAARKGHINVLEWQLERNRRLVPLVSADRQCMFSKKHWKVAFYAAIRHGQLKVPEWVFEHGFTFALPTQLFTHRTDVLEWLLQRGALIPDEVLCTRLAARGHLEALAWLFRAFPDRKEIFKGVPVGGRWYKSILKWAKEIGLSFSAQVFYYQSIRLLKWAAAEGLVVWDAKVFLHAASSASLEDLKWLRAAGCPWDSHLTEYLGRWKSYECFRWAIDNGCPWERSKSLYILQRFAADGNLEALQWARSRGLPWDNDTCDEAARYGHLEVLQWAYANGCPLGSKILEKTTSERVKQWLRERHNERKANVEFS